jgi:hypothetical protein
MRSPKKGPTKRGIRLKKKIFNHLDVGDLATVAAFKLGCCTLITKSEGQSLFTATCCSCTADI